MRVLLDECLPKRLKRYLAGHEVETVTQAGWAGSPNPATGANNADWIDEALEQLRGKTG